MLKEFKVKDIDIIMNLWKKEFKNNNKKIENNLLTKKYTDIQTQLLDKKSTTILYTEDDIIEGFISINADKQIFLIYVDKKIRREGIGSVLIESCKKKFDKLNVCVNREDKIYKLFLEKNGFNKIDKEDITHSINNDLEEYEWSNINENRVNVVYFDGSIDEKLKDNSQKLEPINVKIKEILNNRDIKDIKTYLKVRKMIEQGFKSKKVILYLDYNNYNSNLDEIIKDIIKVNKTNFVLAISEPMVIENYKATDKVKEIEESYKEYKVYKIDTTTELQKDISINKLLEQKMKILYDKLEKIAQNM